MEGESETETERERGGSAMMETRGRANRFIQVRRRQIFDSEEVARLLTGDLNVEVYDSEDSDDSDPSYVAER